MANSIIYYLKKVYHKDGKDPHISCFLNFLKSDLLFFTLMLHCVVIQLKVKKNY